MTNVQKVWINLAVGIGVPLGSAALMGGSMYLLKGYGWLVPIVVILAAGAYVISLLVRLELRNAREKDAKETGARREGWSAAEGGNRGRQQ